MNLASSENEFSNGIAIVAGGSGGLGAAICDRLAASGLDVALTFHNNRRRADEVKARIEGHGRRAITEQVNLADAGRVAEFVAQVEATWGNPGTVVYAAGPKLHFKYISQLDPELFRSTIDQDVCGCFNLISATLPSLRMERGALVALITPAIRRYTKKDLLSVSPKAAIHGIIAGVAVEEGRFGVRANSVGVGLVGDAGLFDTLVADGGIDDKYMEATYEVVPLKRLGLAAEIAEAVHFLASKRASFITGQALMADGGLSA